VAGPPEVDNTRNICHGNGDEDGGKEHKDRRILNGQSVDVGISAGSITVENFPHCNRYRRNERHRRYDRSDESLENGTLLSHFSLTKKIRRRRNAAVTDQDLKQSSTYSLAENSCGHSLVMIVSFIHSG
jgi:hypothetical protein